MPRTTDEWRELLAADLALAAAAPLETIAKEVKQP